MPGFLLSFAGSNVKRKTNKDDALKLARMAAMNELKAVHMPSETHREFRSLVKYRKTLDCRINKMKCTIRAWFVNHGIEIDTGEKAWHSGRERINSFRKSLIECQPNELWKGGLDLEQTQFDALTVQLESVVKKLEALGKADPRIQRIRTIPGVGPRTAEILVACIDDPHRFNNGREVSAYFGLVPRQYQSGETDRICGKQKTRKKKAAVALARKIAVLAWAMLRVEKDWARTHMIQVTESFGKMKRELKQSLQSMKPKENSDQRKSRLRREAREAKAVADRPKKSVRTATATSGLTIDQDV